jgi:ribosomal protein L7/L12
MDDVILLRRLQQIEAQLEILSVRAGVPYTRPGSSLPPSVRDLKDAGKTIQAIQELRQLTSMSLIEAKEAVENG